MVRYRIQNDNLKGGGGMAELNEKQQRFVEEYMIDLNATQAAIRAGYSVKSASDIGGQLLGKTHVQRAIARAKAERSRRTGITSDRVLQELARIAFVNAADLIDPETAQVLPDASPDDLKVISGVKVKYVPHKELNDDGEIMIVDAIEREVKMCDKVRALDMLCKHLGLYDAKQGDDEGGTGIVELPAAMPTPLPPEDDEDGDGP